MVEKLPQPNFEEKNQSLNLAGVRLKIIIWGLFFGGLFLLAVGAGLFLFKNQSSDDIQIISDSSLNSQGSQIIVHVDGAVVEPGVYTLEPDTRVNDAIIAAGGLSGQADQARINLAAKISDGQKVYIPAIGESMGESVGGSGGQVAGGSVNQLVNINTASEAELDKLPGIGPVTTQKIIASRPYSALEELLTKKVVNSSVWEKIKGLITY
jgi:competence protein ComEA